MRQRRLTKKRRRQMKRNLYIKPLVTVYIAFLLLALTVDGTAAKFNDITSVEGAFQVGEWTPDIPDDSSLTFIEGVKGDCEKITATVKNTGDKMTTPWKYHVHRKAKSDWPRVEGFEGEIKLLENKETVEVSFTPDQNGQYRFEFVRPEGYQGNKGGKSGVIKLKDCEEKQSVNMQENNEEQVEEDTESKQDNENNKENDQESEQKSKDQETKEKSNDENTEDSSTDTADDKDDQKKKQQNTKNEQQQESEQEASAETDPNDDKQQENQASKIQDSKDDDTQVKEEESSNDDQNENE